MWSAGWAGMFWRPLAMALLLLAAGAAAKTSFSDAVGDGDPDVQLVGWFEADDQLTLHATVAQAEPQPVLRWFWGRGVAGESEPAEWYVVHLQGDANVVAGHGGQSRELQAQFNWTQGVVQVSFQRVDASAGNCTVVAADAAAAHGAGFERTDVAPDGLADLQDAWPTHGPCPAAPAAASSSSKGAPAPGLGLLGLALVALTLRRR